MQFSHLFIDSSDNMSKGMISGNIVLLCIAQHLKRYVILHLINKMTQLALISSLLYIIWGEGGGQIQQCGFKKQYSGIL